MTRIPAATAELKVQPKKIRVSVETVKTINATDVPNLEFDQKDI